MYRIFIENREYTKYLFRLVESNGPPVFTFDLDASPNIVVSDSVASNISTIMQQISPIQNHMFSGDIFNIDDKETILHSPIRQQILAGVLILHENRTYGRSKNGRLLYKCIPDDKHLPPFLVPYDISMGFSKKQINKYVTFQFTEWSESMTHPYGIIMDTLGGVDSLDVYYEYQLYCKSLHVSLNEMTKRTKRALSAPNDYLSMIHENPQFVFSPCSSPFIFSIDPEGSTDYDDAFSIETIVNEKSGETEYVVTVYIANVFVWLETLGIWDSFSRRVSTIYLPDKRRPMLPTILSDTWCSLQENTERFVFAIEWKFQESGVQIGEPKMMQTKIRVSKNFVYESTELLEHPHYQILFSLCKQMNKYHMKSSHDVVSHWMIKTNTCCAEFLESRGLGIFRYISLDEEIAQSKTEYSGLSENSQRAIQKWNNTTGQYSLYSEKSTKYIHITSPIRRLVDLLNQMILFKELGVVCEFSKKGKEFLENWINQLEYINTTMRSIRKVQMDCYLLARVTKETSNFSDRVYSGVVFDKVCKNDGLMIYMVYLEDLKLFSKITVDVDLPNYSVHSFRLFLFQDEYCTKRKIKLQWV
jgi:exoribonuclease R